MTFANFVTALGCILLTSVAPLWACVLIHILTAIILLPE